MRHHGEIVRIEIAREELHRAFDPAMAKEFARIFKDLGFKFVTLDLEGFRLGIDECAAACGGITEARGMIPALLLLQLLAIWPVLGFKTEN